MNKIDQLLKEEQRILKERNQNLLGFSSLEQ